ncbi:MAG: aspartate aminotransferase family protein [Candidatus Krumholzibacteriia bacterium]
MRHVLHYPGQPSLAPEIVRAEGCHVYDAAGNRWLDLESGVWCTPLGHGHPRMLAVLQRQAAAMIHAGFNVSPPVVDAAAAEILDQLNFPGGRCVFLCSGSEAVEYGLRVMRRVQGRPRVVTMADSYFGAYGQATARDGDDWWCDHWLADCATCPYLEDCAEFCDHWTAIPHDDLGGLLLEPGSSAGLVRFPPAKFVRALARTVGDNGGLVMVNEVTTGLGRTGRWFGYEHFGITPDLVALGKGLGNGYPVSCLAMNADVVARLDGQPLAYAQSHQNDPLGAAVAREVLQVLRDEHLIERAAATGEHLGAALANLASRCDRVAEVRGRGLMWLIRLHDDAEETLTAGLHEQLARRGYLVGRRLGQAALRLDPPLGIAEDLLDGFVAELSGLVGRSRR